LALRKLIEPPKAQNVKFEVRIEPRNPLTYLSGDWEVSTTLANIIISNIPFLVVIYPANGDEQLNKPSSGFLGIY